RTRASPPAPPLPAAARHPQPLRPPPTPLRAAAARGQRQRPAVRPPLRLIPVPVQLRPAAARAQRPRPAAVRPPLRLIPVPVRLRPAASQLHLLRLLRPNRQAAAMLRPRLRRATTQPRAHRPAMRMQPPPRQDVMRRELTTETFPKPVPSYPWPDCLVLAS